MLMAGMRETKVRLDLWFEVGLGHQKNNSRGCMTMGERLDSTCTYVTE